MPSFLLNKIGSQKGKWLQDPIACKLFQKYKNKQTKNQTPERAKRRWGLITLHVYPGIQNVEVC